MERSLPVDARIAAPSFRTKYTVDELGWPMVSNARGTNSYPLRIMSMYLVHLSSAALYISCGCTGFARLLQVGWRESVDHGHIPHK